MELIDKHIDDLKQLCKTFHVSELYPFGFVVTSGFEKDSDIDFLVQFGNIDLMDYLDNYIDFKKSLQALYNKKIDLVEQQTLENPILKRSIDRNKRKIYG
jgi:predicted nucleotidyltransferase